jgi:hypothetical protein
VDVNKVVRQTIVCCVRDGNETRERRIRLDVGKAREAREITTELR